VLKGRALGYARLMYEKLVTSTRHLDQEGEIDLPQVTNELTVNIASRVAVVGAGPVGAVGPGPCAARCPCGTCARPIQARPGAGGRVATAPTRRSRHAGRSTRCGRDGRPNAPAQWAISPAAGRGNHGLTNRGWGFFNYRRWGVLVYP
jgi:hypothetical protein